jgi:hypothetical protein
MRHWMVATAVVLLIAPACSLKKMTAGMTVSVARDAAKGLNDETDYELAEAAAPGNLKFLEGLYYVIPDNEELLELLAQNYAGYAFAFVEERAAEAGAAGDDKRQEHLQERAATLYERGGRYGLKLLGLKKGFDEAWKKGGRILEQKLADFSKEEAGRLFWTAYAWAGAINLAQDRVENLALLPKVKLLVARVLQLDESFFNGGPHLFFGGLYMALPKALGGNPELAKQHFEKAIALSQGKALLAKVMYASLYASKVRDRALFDRLVKEVEEAPVDILPGQTLPNVLAKRKAARLAKRAKEMFQ